MIILWHSIVYLLGELKDRLTGRDDKNKDVEKTDQNQELHSSPETVNWEFHSQELLPQQTKLENGNPEFWQQKEKDKETPNILKHFQDNKLVLDSTVYQMTRETLINLEDFNFHLIDSCEQKFQSSRVDLFETSTISSDELSDAELKTTSLNERQLFLTPKLTTPMSAVSISFTDNNNCMLSNNTPLSVVPGTVPGLFYLKLNDPPRLDPKWIKFCEKKGNEVLVSPTLLQESIHHSCSLLSACSNCASIQNPTHSQMMCYVGQNHNGSGLQCITHSLCEEGSWVQSQFHSDLLTLAVPCESWPQETDIFWPCKEALAKARELGCHIVPARSQNNNSSLLWRFCFDLPCQTMINSLCEEWRHSFATFKKLCHVYLIDTAMTDELVRNLLCHVVSDVSKRNCENDTDKLGLLIKKLLQCLKTQSCPSYFLPEYNMLKSWSSNDRTLAYQGALELQYSIQCPDIMGYISEGSECGSQRSHLPYLPSNITLTWLEALAAFNQISNFVPENFSERQVEKLFMQGEIIPLQLVEAVIHYVRTDGKFPLPLCLHTPQRQQFLNFIKASVPGSEAKLFAEKTKLLQGFLCLQYAILERMEEYFNEHPEEAVTIEYE
ncbi:uncharacterized protein LOC106177224 isoform X2 [Lingula anatina]|nr:uncharacterized protein LOC106177224 isoform X2 [Lingula anatina]|eukprot:XP_013415399.1 uncharacterized protein LOC106177224 isoform X2 [Lingula anatina]